jgi:hypothetical protein
LRPFVDGLRGGPDELVTRRWARQEGVGIAHPLWESHPANDAPTGEGLQIKLRGGNQRLRFRLLLISGDNGQSRRVWVQSEGFRFCSPNHSIVHLRLSFSGHAPSFGYRRAAARKPLHMYCRPADAQIRQCGTSLQQGRVVAFKGRKHLSSQHHSPSQRLSPEQRDAVQQRRHPSTVLPWKAFQARGILYRSRSHPP